MKKFHFSVLFDCNENCIFCAKGPPPAGVKHRIPLAEAREIILKERAKGCDTLALDGGEPTLLPYLPEIIKTALTAGYTEVQVLTNGVELSDKRKLEAIKRTHPRATASVRFGVSLHSHLKTVSEKLTRSKGTHARTIAGLHNIRDSGFDFFIYHVITEDNYSALRNFSKFVIKNFPTVDSVTFSYIYPVFRSVQEMDVYPRLSLVPPYFSAAVKMLMEAGVAVSLSDCGMIPLCLMGGNETLFFKAFTENDIGSISNDMQKSEPRPFFREAFINQNKTKAPQCAACVLDRVCGGIWKLYAQRYGTGELKPYKKSYFKKLPASGASLTFDLSESLRYQDPTGYTRICILELRYHGFTGFRLCGAKPGSPLASAAEEFARSIGCSASVSRTNRHSPKKIRRAGR